MEPSEIKNNKISIETEEMANRLAEIFIKQIENDDLEAANIKKYETKRNSKNNI